VSKPPLLSGRAIVKAFIRAGYTAVHQRGSHVKLADPGRESILIVPDHAEVDRWLLKNLIKDAGMSVEEFIRYTR